MELGKNYGITNAIMFAEVFSELEIAQEFLELLLDISIERLELVETEAAFKPSLLGRGVRLDVYVKDAAGTVYDVEMQATGERDLLKRVRYYQSMLDSKNLRHGRVYQELPRSYVIFICTFDPLGDERGIYTIGDCCFENEKRVDLERQIILLNSRHPLTGKPALDAFLSYVNGATIGTEQEWGFARKVNKRVADFEASPEWRGHMLISMEERLKNMQWVARREGREEGLAEGRSDLLGRLLDASGMDYEQFIEHLGISQRDMDSLLKGSASFRADS